MSGTCLDTEHWRRRLADLAERHGVPGAALGIGYGDEVAEVACGVLNVSTGVVTTPNSFQIGSITKVWTTTLVMRLVDEGEVDLDAPVVTVPLELALVDADVAERVTMRHLLSHTSGIDGDVFADTGRGDDCLVRYVAELRPPRKATRSRQPSPTATRVYRGRPGRREDHRDDLGRRPARADY